MYIDINGIKLFYEQTGIGEPIILLHGNGQDHEIFDKLIAQLSKNFTVYSLDNRSHGKSSKVKELSYDDMTEDVVKFIQALKIEKPILLGFSDGGIIGMLLAIKYPHILSKMVIIGANLNPGGIKEHIRLLIKFTYTFTRSSKFKLMITQPDISTTELEKIMIPTLILAGENDFIKEEHTKTIAHSISCSKLKIVEKENHTSFVVHSPKLYEIVKSFLLK